MLCGRTWEKLETLYDALINMADPSMVSISSLCFENSRDSLLMVILVTQVTLPRWSTERKRERNTSDGLQSMVPKA